METKKTRRPRVAPNSPRESKIKVLAFFGFIALMAAASILTGYIMRGDLQEKAGPVEVAISNESGQELRVDLYMNDTLAPLQELDPGEGGVVYFNPESEASLLIRLFRNGTLVSSLEEGTFLPNTPSRVRIRIESPDQVRISYPEAERKAIGGNE